MPETKRPVPESARPGATQRLRHAIDSGKTGDKVAHPDPAAAPLGTDDEAGDPHDETGLRIAREAGSRPSGGKRPPG